MQHQLLTYQAWSAHSQLQRLSCAAGHTHYTHKLPFNVQFLYTIVLKTQVPEFRVAYSINTDALDALYKRLKPKGVTMSGLLAKAAGVALAKHPVLYAGLQASSITACYVVMHC